MVLLTSMNNKVIFDFNKTSNVSNWNIVNDGVMGGRSNGSFKLNSDGHGVFAGNISLENNGGFSSVRYGFQEINVTAYTKIRLKVKGDGKQYQFRIKNDSGNYYSYISYFTTTEDWQVIDIPLESMYPSFRGRRLNQANFDHASIEEVVFLFGNKKAEVFNLYIDSIELF